MEGSRKLVGCSAMLVLALGSVQAQELAAPMAVDEWGSAPGYPGCDWAGCSNRLNDKVDIDVRTREADGQRGFAVLSKSEAWEPPTALVQFIPFDNGLKASHTSCWLNDKPDWTIVAVGTGVGSDRTITKLTQAWKLDGQGRLRPLASLAGLKCQSDNDFAD